MKYGIARSWGFLFVVILSVCLSRVVANVISLDPRNTFYRVSSLDSAGDAVPVDINSLGIASGDEIELTALGDFALRYSVGDVQVGASGVFSGSNILLDRDQISRVADAIDAGEDYISLNTWAGDHPTDIPEDFWIDRIVLQVPVGATHLFFSPEDTHFEDNEDPDGDYGVRIRIVPEDCNGDNNFDLFEFATLQVCFTGDGGVAPTGCECVSFDGDGDVDEVDLEEFISWAYGPNP